MLLVVTGSFSRMFAGVFDLKFWWRLVRFAHRVREAFSDADAHVVSLLASYVLLGMPTFAGLLKSAIVILRASANCLLHHHHNNDRGSIPLNVRPNPARHHHAQAYR